MDKGSNRVCGKVEGKAVKVYECLIKVKVRKREIRSECIPFKGGRVRYINMLLNDKGYKLKA